MAHVHACKALAINTHTHTRRQQQQQQQVLKLAFCIRATKNLYTQPARIEIYELATGFFFACLFVCLFTRIYHKLNNNLKLLCSCLFGGARKRRMYHICVTHVASRRGALGGGWAWCLIIGLLFCSNFRLIYWSTSNFSAKWFRILCHFLFVVHAEFWLDCYANSILVIVEWQACHERCESWP